MAKQVINIGTTADDGTGESIRSAFDKANDNFTELYDLGGGSSGTGIVSENFTDIGSSTGGFWQRALVAGDDKKLFYYFGTLTPRIQVPLLPEGFSVTFVGKFNAGSELDVDVTGAYAQVLGPVNLLQGADGQPVALSLTVSTDGAAGLALQVVGSGAEPVPNAQTGTTYTIALSDAFTPVTMDNGAANVVTLPADATVNHTVGTVIPIVQLGAGVTTITAASGVTMNGGLASSKSITARYQSAALLKLAANTWVLSGSIA